MPLLPPQLQLGLLAGPQAPQAPRIGPVYRALDGSTYTAPMGQSGGGSVYGQNNLQSASDRYADMATRGGAPFTANGLGQAFGNAMGIIGTGGLTTGLKSMAEMAAGQTPGTLGGFSNIEGHYGIPKAGIHTFADYQKARRGAAAATQTRIAEGYKASGFGGGTGNQSVAGGRSVGGLAVGNDGRIAGGI